MPARKKIHSEAAEPTIEDIVGAPVADEKKEEIKESPAEVTAPVPEPQPQIVEKVVEPRFEQLSVPTQEVHGILDIQPEGHGFLRPKFIPSQRDIYISQSQIRRFMLRPGGFNRRNRQAAEGYGKIFRTFKS